MKPYIHAENSAKKFGGKIEDYLPIHNWFDDTKAHFGNNLHRAIKHHSQGIFECERLFGVNIKNSDGKLISTRDIGEQHVIEDLGFIPSISDYLKNMTHQEWMSGQNRDKQFLPISIPKTPAPGIFPIIFDDNDLWNKPHSPGIYD